jgi:hypothetical protein
MQEYIFIDGLGKNSSRRGSVLAQKHLTIEDIPAILWDKPSGEVFVIAVESGGNASCLTTHLTNFFYLSSIIAILMSTISC